MTETSIDLTYQYGAGMPFRAVPISGRDMTLNPHINQSLGTGRPLAKHNMVKRLSYAAAMPGEGLSWRLSAASASGSWKTKHLRPKKVCAQQPTTSTTHLSNTHDKLGNGSFYYAYFTDGTTNMGKFKEIMKAIQLRSNEAKTKAQMSGSNSSTHLYSL